MEKMNIHHESYANKNIFADVQACHDEMSYLEHRTTPPCIEKIVFD